MEQTEGTHWIRYLGTRRALLGQYVNLYLFGILTIGFYVSWGMTQIRRYQIQHLQVGKDRLQYSGKGWHLFKGGAIGTVFWALVGMTSPLQEKFLADYFAQENLQACHFVRPGLLLWLWCLCGCLYLDVCDYCSWRYLLSHLTWRNIRGSARASWWRLLLHSLYRSSANCLSLGLTMPWSDVKKYQYRMAHARIGTTPCSYHRGSMGKLVCVHLVTWLLFPFTAGISRLWYQAALRRHLWNGTSVGNLRLRSTCTGWGLFRLYLGSGVLFLAPWLLAGALFGLYQTLCVPYGYLGDLFATPAIRVCAIATPLLSWLCLLPMLGHRHIRYWAQNIAVLGDLEAFWEQQGEAAPVEPAQLPNVDMGSIFPI